MAVTPELPSVQIEVWMRVGDSTEMHQVGVLEYDAADEKFKDAMIFMVDEMRSEIQKL